MASLAKRVRDMVGDALGAAVVEANIEKSLEIARSEAARVGQPESLFWDPMSLFMGREWLVKRGPVALTFDDLRRMAHNPIIASIVQTRLNQAAQFMVPARGASSDPGFVITSDDEAAMRDEDATEAITQFVFHCGLDQHGDNLLETLARKTLRDSLVLDQMCAEIVPRRNGMPAYVVAVDGGTVRRLKRSLEFTRAPNDEPFYAQVVNDRIVAEYAYEQLIYGIRNPQTDVKLNGYGMSELEYLFRVITTILNAERFNFSTLSQGGVNKGLLVVKKPPDRMQFEAFKRDFRESLRNAAQWWRAPVLGVPEGAEIDWVRLDQNQRDMEYAQLFDFLVKEACGVYQIDPAEINWSIGAAGGRTTFESRQDAKLRNSQKKGLKPLLTFFANTMTAYVVQPLDMRFRMEFIGIAEDRELASKIATSEVTHYRTINEVRAELGMKEVPGGDVILSELYFKSLERLEGEIDGELGEDEMDDGQRAMLGAMGSDEQAELVLEGDDAEAA